MIFARWRNTSKQYFLNAFDMQNQIALVNVIGEALQGQATDEELY